MAAAQASSAVASLTGLIKRAAFEPILTGPLLLILTRGPENLRQPLQRFLLKPFASDRNDLNLVRVAYIVKTLKWLFAFGLAARVNDILTVWAQNHWRWSKPGVPWDFDARNKKEIAVVTGGCSGFGYLTVKGLVGKMKVVVLDVQDLPEDLKSCMLIPPLPSPVNAGALADCMLLRRLRQLLQMRHHIFFRRLRDCLSDSQGRRHALHPNQQRRRRYCTYHSRHNGGVS